MTAEIAIVFTILGIAILLFITEWVRVDIVALMVAVSLAIAGQVTAQEAVSGFANPAVITVWAVLILSAGLSRTGLANLLGGQVLRFAGRSEVRLILLIMISVGVLSGFMNDIGVAALMLPVVIDIASSAALPASKLLMPLAFASLLGGLTTLIGTPPNILISDALRGYGLEPFGMFDYTPVGVVVLVTGVAFVVLVGRRLLPARSIEKVFAHNGDLDLDDFFKLRERLFLIELPERSVLAGKTIAESRLGSALGLNLIAILRDGKTDFAPMADTLLQPGDKLLVGGRVERLSELGTDRYLELESEDITLDLLTAGDVHLVEVRIDHQAAILGKKVADTNLREVYGINLLAITRREKTRPIDLQRTVFMEGDILLLQGPNRALQDFGKQPGMNLSSVESADIYRLNEWLFAMQIPPGSSLAGQSLSESQLGDAYGLSVLGIRRGRDTILAPARNELLREGDTLLIQGSPEDLRTFKGLQELEIDQRTELELRDLESEQVGLTEVVLSPHTTLVGKTLRELHFRAKYGLTVLAIWREGRLYRSNLRDLPLKFGDTLLLYGMREKLIVLGSDPDFLVLTEEAQVPPRTRKAPIALLIMVAVLLPVVAGWLPIAITAVGGVVLMVLTGCLTMDEAYRSIEWKAIFLIAGMLPLGIALERTGAAQYVAENMVSLIGGMGPLAVTAGLFVLAALASQFMPNPAVAVLLAPIAYNTALDLGVSPYPLMMVVAISASAAFLSPVAHSSNILVMGPGGYRFADYLRLGIPLTLVVLAVTLVVLPIFWPF